MPWVIFVGGVHSRRFICRLVSPVYEAQRLSIEHVLALIGFGLFGLSWSVLASDALDLSSITDQLRPKALAKGEQRHLFDGDRLVLNLGQAREAKPAKPALLRCAC